METRTESAPHARVPDGERRGSAPPPAETIETTTVRRRPPLAVWALGAIALVAILVFGFRYLSYATTHQTTDDARVDADTVTVTSKIAERVQAVLVNTNDPVRKGQILVRLDSTDERNAVQAAEAAVAAQRAQANAAQQNVDLTRAQVQAQNAQGSGGIASAQASIANAQAEAASAQQQAGAARAAIGQAQAQLRAAQSQVPAAREALVRANADLARYQALARTGDIAQAQLDAQRAMQAQAAAQYRAAQDNAAAAQTAVAQAQARYTSAVAATGAAQAGIGAQRGQLTTAQGKLTESGNPYRVSAAQAQANAASAQVGSLQAQLRTVRDRLAYTEIRSPIDGHVGTKDIEVGATVQPGQSLLNLVPNAGMYITANYKETQLGNVRVGQPVDIGVDAYKGTRFHGHVVAIAPASQNTFALVPAQNATGNFVKVTQRIPVRIAVDDAPPDKPLRVGMSVETSIKVK